MKSKRCCFNHTIFKKNISHFWPIWLIYFIYLLLIGPIQLWTGLKNYINWDYTIKEAAYMATNSVISSWIITSPNFFACIIAVMAVFSYIGRPRSANMIHALPVNRKELFLTNYVSGLLCLLVSQILTFVITVFVCLANQVTCIQHYFMALLISMGTTFIGYSMAVFVAMITGQIFIIPIFFFIMNFLYVGFRFFLSLLSNLLCYGFSSSGWRPGYSGMLSPWYFLETHLKVDSTYMVGVNRMQLTIMGGKYLLIYAGVAIAFSVAAWLLYKKRQIETAGDLICVRWVQPIFRWGAAFSGMCFVAFMVTDTLRYTVRINKFYCMMICGLLFGVIFFFVAEMILKKSFKVIHKKSLLECAVFTVASLLIFLGIHMDLAGIEKRVPKAEQVKEGYLAWNSYQVRFSEEDIEELYQIHQQLLDEKKNYQDLYESEASYVIIKYCLKNGDTVRRTYPIPLSERTIENMDEVVLEIVECLQNPQNLIKGILGEEYEKNQYLGGYAEIYEENRSFIMDLTDEETKLVAEALIEDINSGATRNIMEEFSQNVSTEPYLGYISLEISNRIDNKTTSDYYHNAEQKSTVREAYFELNSKCKHLLEVLRTIETEGREN